MSEAVIESKNRKSKRSKRYAYLVSEMMFQQTSHWGHFVEAPTSSINMTRHGAIRNMIYLYRKFNIDMFSCKKCPINSTFIECSKLYFYFRTKGKIIQFVYADQELDPTHPLEDDGEILDNLFKEKYSK